MKNIVLSTVAVLAMGSFAVAGGDIAPVEEPVVVVPEPVVTDSGAYLGLGYSYMMDDVTERAFGYKDWDHDQSAMMLQAGYKFNKYIAVEGRYWLGLDDNVFGHLTGPGDVFESDISAWGIYVKPMYPVTESFNVYGLLGYGDVDLNGGANVSNVNGDGFSWGVGAEYEFNENWSMFLDYVAFDDSTFDYTPTNHQITTDNEHSLDTVNFGVTYKF